MSKYDSLWNYIKENGCERLTFAEIEAILGFPLDHSFLTYKKELTACDCEVGKISRKAETVEFRKIAGGQHDT